MACQFCHMPNGNHDAECPYDFASLKPETIVFSADDYDALARAIENPPEPSDKLIELMRRKPQWEK